MIVGGPARIVVLSLGGALGVNARYWLAIWIDARLGKSYPWATFAINVSGAFALGVLATLMARLAPDHPLRLLALVGFLGGYTTFSTFALESYTLWAGGQVGRSLAYLGSSVFAGFIAVVLGVALALALGGGPSQPDRDRAGTSGLPDAPASGVSELAEVS